MSQGLDIFEVRQAGNMWIDSANTIIEAVTIVSNKGPGIYVVFLQDDREMKYYKVDLGGKVSPIDDCNGAV